MLHMVAGERLPQQQTPEMMQQRQMLRQLPGKQGLFLVYI